MQYWDNSGAAPATFDSATFLEGKTGRVGVRHIALYCADLGWSVQVSTHSQEQSYLYTFDFELLPEDTIEF
jgi:hypothetical protein